MKPSDEHPSGPPAGAIYSAGPPGSEGPPVAMPTKTSSPPTRPKRLILCLSGGGLRATFFHLGLIRYLAQTKELQRVSKIFAVSGGSILAAHLALRWRDYTGSEQAFEAAAAELRTLAIRDIRGRIVRRWLFAVTCVVPLLLRRFRRDQLLVREYQRFFERDERAMNLKGLNPENGPSVHLLATSLTTGEVCEFSSAGFKRTKDSGPSTSVESQEFTIPLAVAASSAFPPLFPPLRIDTEYFRLSREVFGLDVDFLSDGGVFDNLGLAAAIKSEGKDLVPDADFLVSDASASFNWNTRGSGFWNIIGRTTRTTDILMQRVGELEVEVQRTMVEAVAQAAENQGPTGLDYLLLPRIGVVHINGAVDTLAYHRTRFEFNGFEAKWSRHPRPQPQPSTAPAARSIAAIRTDLDAFTKTECELLEAWGFTQGLKSPFIVRPQVGPPGQGDGLVPPAISDEALKAIGRSSQRRLRLFAFRDPFSVLLWVLWIAIIVLLKIVITAIVLRIHPE